MDESPDNNERTRRALIQRLESLERAGVQQVRKARVPKVAAAAQPARLPIAAVAATPPGVAMPLPPIAPMAVNAAEIDTAASAEGYSGKVSGDLEGCGNLLATVAAEVRECSLCRDLACTRKQTVFGVGSPQARVVFFGEAPGADEDRLGEPFVGRAGQLLTKIIEACGWKRSEVYIMNVLKCRPPENRNPLPQEVENCRPFFERQLEIIRPEYIVCVGTFPSQALLKTDVSVGKLRGRFHRYKDSKVLVTYHPSYLLRNPSAKKYVWEDMQLLLTDMGLPIPKRSASA
jgi:uracil-DNA glycosylase